MPANEAGRVPGASVLETASQWHMRLSALGETDPAALPALDAWIGKAPEHALAFDRVSQAMGILSSPAAAPALSDYGDAALARLDRVPQQHSATRLSRKWAGWAAVAAAASVVLAISFWPAPPPPPVQMAQLVATARQHQLLTLADGTRMSLDSDSRVRIRFTSQVRSVELLAGQARFQVAHEPARRFVVTAGGQNVFAVGTDFNVELAGKRMIVSLLHGRIAVAPGNSAAAGDASAAVQIPRSAVFLTQNEQLDVRDDGAAYLRKNMSSAEALAWERGYISLKNETLADATRRLNRYAGPKILIDDADVARMRISGVFDVGDRKAFLGAVAAVLPVAAHIRGEDTILVSSTGEKSGSQTDGSVTG